MIKHCNIPALGEFDYDDSIFRIDLVENDLYDEWDNYYYLRYIGEETNVSKLKIPVGCINTRFMFEGTLITDPPIIPMGVEDCESMFAHSKITHATNLPASVKNARSMYEDTLIEKAPPISRAIQNGISMFADCKHLKRLAPYIGNGKYPLFPEMFEGCLKLTKEEFIYPDTKDGQKAKEIDDYAREEELPFL